jgi:hypothetical protein
MPEGGTGAGGPPDGDAGPDARGAGRLELHSVVVSYEEGPDRCTVYPRRDRCVERTTEWLSADVCAFVDLRSME